MDEVILNQYKEVEGDRLYQILLNKEKQNGFFRMSEVNLIGDRK